MKKLKGLLLASALFLSACSEKEVTKEELKSDPPNGVYYEIFVRSFADSNNDGIGDLNGVTKKLDYLSDLGIEGIWLMPINPSPSYHGYDVTDYQEVNNDYGTMEDFKKLLKEAHKRDIKVVMDLVVNHTSKEHPWFKESKSSLDNPKRTWYNWAAENTNTSQIGEWNQKVWHGLPPYQYEGIFWDGMPDLNFENQEVRDEIKRIGTYWLELGVDGFRLDAAKHLYSKGTHENDEEKDQAFWKEFRAEMEKTNKDVILVGEVWDSASVVAPYLDKGLTSAFNFDLSTSILNAVKSEKNTGFVYQLEKVRSYFDQKSGGSYIDSTILTNHDMDRTMSQVADDENHAKMAAGILLTLPGNPYIYYGEEIGMKGKKPDEEIREPFPWSEDSKENARWEPMKYNQGTVPLDKQMKDGHSLYNHYKKMIYERRSSDVLIKGEVKSTSINDSGIVSFYRVLDEQKWLVVHNITKSEIEIPLKDIEEKNILFKTNDKAKAASNLKIPAYSTVILKK